MFSLTIALGPTMWTLLFNKKENALKQEMAIHASIQTNTLTGIIDDYGQSLQIMPASVHGWMVEDMEQTRMAHCERMLHQARTQGQAQRMAESDPALRAGTNMRGPEMISPFGANGRR